MNQATQPLIRVLACLALALSVSGMAWAQPEGTLFVSFGGWSQGADDAGAIGVIDQDTGEITILDTPVPGAGITGLAFDGSGRLYGSTSLDTLIEINPETGALIRTIGTMTAPGGQDGMTDLAWDPVNGGLYGSSHGKGPSGQDELYLISTTDASLTSMGSMDGALSGGFTSITFGNAGVLVGKTSSSAQIGTFNTADATLIGSTSLDPAVGVIALGTRLSDNMVFMGECCADGDRLANDIYTLALGQSLAPQYFVAAGGTRRVHDFAWTPEVFGAEVLPVPTLQNVGTWTLILLVLGLAGFALVRRTA